MESVAGATLLQSAPSIEWVNTEATQKFDDLARALAAASREKYLDLLHTDGFAESCSTFPTQTVFRTETIL